MRDLSVSTYIILPSFILFICLFLRCLAVTFFYPPYPYSISKYLFPCLISFSYPL